MKAGCEGHTAGRSEKKGINVRHAFLFPRVTGGKFLLRESVPIRGKDAFSHGISAIETEKTVQELRKGQKKWKGKKKMLS